MLRATNLAKRYGDRPVLRGLSFEVETGTVVAVVGANGAGKSTLLRIVAGLLRPSQGDIEWREPASAPILAGSDIGQICGLSAPDAPLYRELTVVENLEFFSRARGLGLRTDSLQTHLKRFGLEPRRDDMAGELSSGLRARLQLGVATLSAPRILLLDEPSANLDEAGRALLEQILREQRGRGLALVATNDEREAALCDARIAL